MLYINLDKIKYGSFIYVRITYSVYENSEDIYEFTKMIKQQCHNQSKSKKC